MKELLIVAKTVRDADHFIRDNSLNKPAIAIVTRVDLARGYQKLPACIYSMPEDYREIMEQFLTHEINLISMEETIKRFSLTNKTFQTLGSIQRTIAQKQVQIIDSSLAQYIKSAIQLLETQGKDIDDYALIAVNNPMELIENGLRVTSQWRIVHIDKLQNIPAEE